MHDYGVNVGGSASSTITRLTLEVPPAMLAEWWVESGKNNYL